MVSLLLDNEADPNLINSVRSLLVEKFVSSSSRVSA